MMNKPPPFKGLHLRIPSIMGGGSLIRGVYIRVLGVRIVA